MWQWFTYDEASSDGEEEDSTASNSGFSPTVHKLDPRVTAATLAQVGGSGRPRRVGCVANENLKRDYFAGQRPTARLLPQSVNMCLCSWGLFACKDLAT